MTINGEPCELIVDFNQLRPGDLIYIMACDWCPKAPHRAMLARGVMGPVQLPHGPVALMPGFPLVPEPHKLPPGQQTMLTPPSVAIRTVWRVIVPPREEPKDEPTTTGKDVAVTINGVPVKPLT